MGCEFAVPKKLVNGMAVVVWIKPEYTLFQIEVDAGLDKEVWLKGELVSNFGLIIVRINGQTISNIIKGLIIIRSCALADNLSEGIKRQRLVAAAKRQRNEMLASVKIVSHKIS